MKNLIRIIVLMPCVFAISNAEVKSIALTKNPFIKPKAVHENNLQVSPDSKNATILTDRNLRATLKSTDRSIANIDGIMVFEGETIKGYILVSVDEGSATLEKNGKKITLNVSELHKKLNK